MPSSYRFDGTHETGFRRYTLGVLVSSACKEIGAAAVAADRHADSRLEVRAARTGRVPEEIAGTLAQLAAGGPCGPATLTTLRSQLAEVEAGLVGELLGELALPAAAVLAVGVHDPGLWTFGPSPAGPVGYLGLCDPARLAELTGLTVVDAFPARDLAAGGQGGPITAMAEWFLLREPRRTRVLLDLGQTARVTYLPAAMIANAASRVLAFEVGPGTRLLDSLTQRLTGGQNRFDPGGRMAVQGRRIPELIEHWLRDPYFERPLPRWHPRGVRPERFLMEAMQMAVGAGWSVRDLLCTATHFVAEAIAQTIRRRLPDDVPIDEILVTGGGQSNGMLLREIAARLPRLTIVAIGEAGVPAEALGPASIAVLAALHLDQTPGNSAAITGAEVPRALGRLTPGSPLQWQQLLGTMAHSRSVVRPLRSAI